MPHCVKIIFVHGWGMNSAVWDECLQFLPDSVDVQCIDLPGHGMYSTVDVENFDVMVKAVALSATEPVVWVGWSLGGLVCLKLAQLYPEKVLGLCLVATSPCFVKKENWHTAIDKAVFDDFSIALKRDIDKTIKRFLALQVTGSKITMTTIKQLQLALQTRGRASDQSLDLGLAALLNVDVRAVVKSLTLPVKWILGARDSLVPVSLADELEHLSPTHEVDIFEDAAHAPFLSHPKQFCETITQFSADLKTIESCNK